MPEEKDDKPTITVSNIFGRIPQSGFTLYDSNGNFEGEFEVDEKKSDAVFTYRPMWPEIIKDEK